MEDATPPSELPQPPPPPAPEKPQKASGPQGGEPSGSGSRHRRRRGGAKEEAEGGGHAAGDLARPSGHGDGHADRGGGRRGGGEQGGHAGQGGGRGLGGQGYGHGYGHSYSQGYGQGYDQGYDQGYSQGGQGYSHGGQGYSHGGQGYGQRGQGYGSPGQGGQRSRRHGGGRDYQHELPPPPPAPWQAAEEDKSLKDLLLQVAPQARIVEGSSRLSSKASANILSKVFSVAAQNTSSGDWNNEGLEYGVDGASGAGSSAGPREPPAPPAEDDDEMFMERWSGLFSKGSPLVDGRQEDPFKDYNSRRTKVVWKKNSDRPGHHTRYQARKNRKEKDPNDPQGESDHAGAEGREEGDAAVMYDASRTRWRPERPPAGI